MASSVSSKSLPHVVIVGGGFGGLYAARALGKAPVRVTLIDRRNHHLFQPLLYQVATAALNPSDIAAPIRAILRKNQNTEVVMAEVESVQPQHKSVRLKDGTEISYDYLLIATGATHSYFGRDDWAKYAMGLKSVEDALEIRRRVLSAYEAAERETDPERIREWLTFVIVGGGPTGVELAGALAEIAHSVADDFRKIDSTEARIILLEGLPQLLGAYPKDLAEKARKSLTKLGVEVRTNTRVTEVDENGAAIGQERIRSKTMVWAAGVAASPLARSLNVPLDRAGRVKVTPNLSVPGYENIFVVGDLASVEQGGKPVPGVAPAAMQGGKQVGRNIKRAVAGKPMKPFRYFDRGTFAVIGRGSAVGLVFNRMWMWGHMAWFAWLAIHIIYLIGFRNRVAVLLNWAWSYFTFGRGARLITGTPPVVSSASQPKLGATPVEPSLALPPASTTGSSSDARVH